MKIYWNIMSVLCFLFPPLIASAQIPSVAALPSASSQNLAAALSAAVLPTHRIFLTVSAETVSLPKESAIPPEKSSLTTVTDAYQRSVRALGAVTAIAPPTMFVLNMKPGEPDIYAGMGRDQIITFLAASLSDPQWRALTGQEGLGLSDLTDQNQRDLFQALFPGGSLLISPARRTPDMPDTPLNLSSEIGQARLRLTASINIALTTKRSPNSFSSDGGDALDRSSNRWMYDSISSNDVYGQQRSGEVPNSLKPGQLNWNLPVLRTPVPLTGLKTVGDLMERVGQITHLELYADKRFEGKSLTILGEENGSALATDLLRALCFCITGTFRQVGPAYVLTDDILGTEARRAVMLRFELEAERRLNEQKDKAADILGTKRSISELTAFDNLLALNAEEQKNVVSSTTWATVTLPLNQLTSAQQESARQEAASMMQADQNLPDDSKPDLTGKISLEIFPNLELIVPSLSSPVESGLVFPNLFEVSAKLQQERAAKLQPETTDPRKPAMPLSQALSLTPRRAILAQPTSAAELVSKIAAMRHLGFNELWLNCFSQGRLQTTMADGKDLLTQALHLTRGTGIHVYAVVDLFQWGTDAPSDAVDMDALGETSPQAETRLQNEAAIEADSIGNPSPTFPAISGFSVKPFDPEIVDRLMAVIKTLARRPGLAGIVLRKTAPGGYDEERDTTYSAHQPDLGYTEPARLAFLRQQHADPLDINKTRIQGDGQSIGGSTGNAEFSMNSATYLDPTTSIPGFDNLAQDLQLSLAWDKFRRDTDLSVLHSLYAAIRAGSQTLPIFVQQQHSAFSQDWYGSWDRPTAPVPEWKIIFIGNRFEPKSDHLAKLQSHLALIGLGADDAHDIAGLASALSDNLKDRTWDGFVWDTTQLKATVLSAQGQIVKPDTKAK